MSPDSIQQRDTAGPTVRWTSDGPTMLLRSGHYFNLRSPERSVIDLEDVGHAREFYGVAQNIVLVPSHSASLVFAGHADLSLVIRKWAGAQTDLD